jgi:ion channel-forming bestrophin family protein
MIVARALRPLRLPMYVGWPLLILFGYDVAVMLAYQMLHWRWLAVPDLPVALYGSAIGVILGFRNNSSYSRWWEGRTLWGAIVNNSRSWARQVTTVMRPRTDAEVTELKAMQQRLVYHQIAFVHALRQHLRRLAPWEELRPFLSEADLNALRDQQNVPLALQQQMGVMLRECQDRGWIDLAQWRALDGTLDDLTDAQGGTERIKNTPMPKQYDYFPQLFVHMYCLVLPLAMVSSLLWLTPLGSTLVGFIFLALDKIGRDLENPFDNTVYDVPITSISKTIEGNLRQMLGEAVVAAPEKLVEDVLW